MKEKEETVDWCRRSGLAKSAPAGLVREREDREIWIDRKKERYWGTKLRSSQENENMRKNALDFLSTRN